MRFNKLVRDKIPDLLKEKGISQISHVSSVKEYPEKLKSKLQEEVNEFLITPNEEELADIFEVINELCDFYKIDKSKVKEVRKEKARKKGTFKSRIILDETK